MVMTRTMVFDGVSWWLIAAAKMPNCLKPQLVISVSWHSASCPHDSMTTEVPLPKLWFLWLHVPSKIQYRARLHILLRVLKLYHLMERKLLTKPGSIEPSVCKSMLLVHHPHASRWASPLRPSPQAIDRDLWAQRIQRKGEDRMASMCSLHLPSPLFPKQPMFSYVFIRVNLLNSSDEKHEVLFSMLPFLQSTFGFHLCCLRVYSLPKSWKLSDVSSHLFQSLY